MAILVTAEQGIGDEMLFYSIIPDLLKTQKDLILEADDSMVPLFIRSFPGIHVVPRRIVESEDGPIFDYDEVVSLTHPPAHVPSGSVPGDLSQRSFRPVGTRISAGGSYGAALLARLLRQAG